MAEWQKQIVGVLHGVSGTDLNQIQPEPVQHETILDQSADWVAHLVTGATLDEWRQIREVKGDVQAAQELLDQFNRLQKYGATRQVAMDMLGLTEEDLGNPEPTVKIEPTQAEKDAGILAMQKANAELTAENIATGNGGLNKGCSILFFIIIGAGSLLASGMIYIFSVIF
jgi:hypothetical protein